MSCVKLMHELSYTLIQQLQDIIHPAPVPVGRPSPAQKKTLKLRKQGDFLPPGHSIVNVNTSFPASRDPEDAPKLEVQTSAAAFLNTL